MALVFEEEADDKRQAEQDTQSSNAKKTSRYAGNRYHPFTPDSTSSDSNSVPEAIDISDLPIPPQIKNKIEFKEEGETTPWQPSNRLQGISIIDEDHIELISRLGGGAFCDVYSANYKGNLVAVKILQRSRPLGLGLSIEEIDESFEWEAISLRGLNHPNVIRLEGLCRIKDAKGKYHRAILLNFCARGSLKGVFEAIKRVESNTKRKKRLNDSRLIELAFEMAQGLSYIHSQGRVHRDLKIENILVEHNCKAKIADLGVAQVDKRLATEDAEVVKKGFQDFIWKAPEIFRDKNAYSQKSDVYAYGLILWSLVTGEEPYQHIDSQQRLFDEVVAKKWREPIPAYCHPELRKLIEQCWHHDPEQRPTMIEVSKKLRTLAEHLHSCPQLMLLEQGLDLDLNEVRSKLKTGYIEPYVTPYSLEEEPDQYWRRRETPFLKGVNVKDSTEVKERKERLEHLSRPRVAKAMPNTLEVSLEHFLNMPNEDIKRDQP